MAVKRLRFKSQKIGGVEIEQPEIFFEWTNLPVAHGYGLAAFAFHVEAENRKWQSKFAGQLGEAVLSGIRGHLDLPNDELRISNFYGGLQILNEIPPLRNIGLNDEGLLYADVDVKDAAKEDLFDALRPDARRQVREVAARAIILGALEVRGRPSSPLASKVPIEWGSFLAGVDWERGRAMMFLDGAKLYDVEVRVRPGLRPSGVSKQRHKLSDQMPLSPRRVAIVEAVRSLWPEGPPKTLTKKERDRQILAWLQKQGQTLPHPRTIKRALDAEYD